MAEQWRYLETPSVRAGLVICRCLPLLLQPLAEVAILSEGIKRDAKTREHNDNSKMKWEYTDNENKTQISTQTEDTTDTGRWH